MSETRSGYRVGGRAGWAGAAIAVRSIAGAGCAKQAGPLGRGFSDSDVAKIEQSIKTEFARRSGLTVQEVKMVRESPGRLTGFARMDIPQLGTVEKACDASFGDHGQSIWQCR